MFLGTFHPTLDEKKRITIPAKLREELTPSCIVTRGLESCLFIYSQQEWEKLTKKLSTLPFTKKDARNFLRFFFSGATTLDFDKQGRILLPNDLLEYASIKKDCVLIGVGERIEIWQEEKWKEFLEANSASLSQTAEHLFELDFEVE